MSLNWHWVADVEENVPVAWELTSVDGLKGDCCFLSVIRDGLGRTFFAQARPVRPKTGTTEHDRSRVGRARALLDGLSVVLGRAFL